MNPVAARKLSDYIKPQEPFFPEAPQVKSIDSLVDVNINVKETRLIPEVQSNFGEPHDLIVFAFSFAGEDSISTAATSANNLVKKFQELKRKRAFPLDLAIVKKATRSGDKYYYDLSDPI